MFSQNISIFVLAIFCLVSVTAAQSQEVKIATEADIKADLALVSCDDQKRLDAVKDLFRKNGAQESAVSVEDLGKVRNLIVKKQGKTDETVIVGAHFDKVDDGCGAIDNWSGIVVLANLYRSMRESETQKTYLFVAFGKEERGLIGSEAMASKIPKEERKNYCAMVNFDSFGFTYPQALQNVSDKPLIALAKEISDAMKIPFGDAGIDIASADSFPFKTRKIPAISFHGLSNNWMSYLHTSSDKLSNVNTQSVYIGYRHGLAFLSKVDQAACDAFRK
jgi:Zn-dependent M28 family amino/carboxypeptidase